MTGIERLYKLIADIDVSADPKLWDILRLGTEGGWDCEEHDDKMLGSTLAAIADQIEREQGGRVSRMRVLDVVTEMERHVSGVEGMEDSPVARWARALREALGGDGRDHAADVSVSAYDLLPQEDREAIAWVREHGGLDAVDAIWDNDVPLAEAVISELWPDGRPDECGNDDVMGELRRRLMPEGMSWPVFEDGAPVRIGDEISWKDEGGAVNSIELQDGGYFVLHAADGAEDWIHPQYFPGKRVKRPAPKVLDADGVEIRAGEMVYHIETGGEFTVIAVDAESGDVHVRWGYDFEDKTGTIDGSYLTHRAPVLAADGRPLRVGETVWLTDGSERHVVLSTEEDVIGSIVTEVQAPGAVKVHISPSRLTHQRPVLGADGVPIKVGDTVYLLPGEWCDKFPCHGFHGGEELEVFAAGEADHVPGSVQCREKEKTLGIYGTCYPQPSQLTHTKPEIDTWQSIEEDAGCTATKYNERRGTIFTTKQQVARDLVRRCRALAERERGE